MTRIPNHQMHGATALAHQANEDRVAFRHVGVTLTSSFVPFLGGFALQSREPNDADLLWGYYSEHIV